MDIVFADGAWEDFAYWFEHDRKVAARIVRLVREIERHPFEGIGKPEPLRHDLAGFWSRRIDQEHRLVYRVANNRVEFLQARYHY